MMHTFRTGDGRTLSYTTAGAGRPLIMLPGGPGIDPVAYFAGTALPGFTQMVSCPQGTGESDPPTTADGYRINGYVQDLEHLRLHLDVPRLTLYGSSHGASTALAYATKYPRHVDRMVLAAGPARMDADFLAALTLARARFATTAPQGDLRLTASDEAAIRMRQADTNTDRQQATRIMIDTYIAHPTPATAQYLDGLAHAPTNSAAIGPMIAEMRSGLDLLTDAHAVSAPTLILTSDLDVRAPAEHMHVIARALPRAELVQFFSAGHLTHVEMPDQWATAVGAFLRP